ncbi:ABC transporter permease subunit [Patulibacter americanus]|uniref:ABC transporter permease subunit n=1 Tax=Patulibacter americanus TaxID=588672 RepID=UPI0003B3544D|nr:ABC transporter permease subunit [Patulibacter americanus]
MSTAAAPVRPRDVTLPFVLRSEWRKLRSLRSTVLTVATAGAFMVLFAAVGAVDLAGDWDGATPAERAEMDAAQALLSGWFLVQVVVGVLGVLTVTSEYASGTIATTLAAVPRRVPVLLAKLAVPAAVTLAVLLPSTLMALVVGNALLPPELRIAAGDDGLVRAAVGACVGLTGVCALGTALGFLLRSTAGAIGLLVTVLLVLPGMVAGLSDGLHRVLPSRALDALATVHPARSAFPLLDWPVALAVLGAYVGLTAAGAAAVLRRRDA